MLAWQEEPEATKIDGVGTFVLTGIRERLEALNTVMIALDTDIDAHASFILHEELERFRLGHILVPYRDPLAREEFLNRNCLWDVEHMTFHPTGCMRYTNPKAATLESAGDFQLDTADAEAARIAMVSDYVRGYFDVARVIHVEENPGKYRDDRVMMNIHSAFQACEWLENNLPADAKSLTESPHLLLEHSTD